MFSLARSARLAAWGTAALRGTLTVRDAVRAVTGDDEPHTVESGAGAPDALPPGAGLDTLLTLLAGLGVRGLRVVLPVPGDLLGLPGPGPFNAAALESGECVLTEPLRDGTGWGLVPQVTGFGSQWEPGVLVSWRVSAVPARRVTDVGSLAEAERELREAMRTATEALAGLEVGRWREDAAGRIAALRSGGLPAGALPPSTPARSAGVLATALRVAAIVDLAGEDDGGAVTAHEAGARRQALRGLDAVTRRALTAAVNALLEPPRG
ncbi:MAG TPA: hypothetical protein VFP72_03440 [Kineosporiaceae bacterium]|nr:hypothetical protein [Kineosporiaceae bacterium]